MYIVFIFLLILGELFWEYFKYSYPEFFTCLQARHQGTVCMWELVVSSREAGKYFLFPQGHAANTFGEPVGHVSYFPKSQLFSSLYNTVCFPSS